MTGPYAVIVSVAVTLCVSCSGSGLSTPSARPYKVVGSDEMTPANGRTARHWSLVSDSSTFEEHAQTLAKAAVDLHSEYGLDLTQVTLYPSESLVGSFMRCAHGFYAADGKAGQGLPGASPDYRATWSILATRDTLTPIELRVAEAWVALAPAYPNKDPWKSIGVDVEALRKRISDELDIELESVKAPHLGLERWLEKTE